MKIGLSLSFCVKDMIDGKVNPDEVWCLITGTQATDGQAWNDLMESYTHFYWKSDPEKAEEIVAKFRSEYRILQPRTFGMQMPNVSEGHWIDFPDCGFGR